jgi:glutathione synthase/RimK-type ligase-like ATP-grasp enzyme
MNSQDNYTKNKTVLVLFSRAGHKKEAQLRIFSILKKFATNYPLNLTMSSLDDLRIEIFNNCLKISDPRSNKDLKDFDFVDFNWWGKAKQHALAASTYLVRHDVPHLTYEISTVMADTKIGEMALMSDHNIPLPHTIITNAGQLKQIFQHVPPIDFPLIMKNSDACGGKDNFLVKDYSEMCNTLEKHPSIDFLVQEFIPNDCDYRCLVFDGEIKLLLKRSRNKNENTHVNNTSAGGIGEVVSLNSISDDSKDFILKAAKVLGRDQFSGVDLLINKYDGTPYILEVNQTPEIEEGAEPEQKMRALFDYIMEATK